MNSSGTHAVSALDDVIVRPVHADDAATVAGIYNHYILETVVTFEETLVSPLDMKARMEEVRAAGLPWLVAERDGNVLGYAYASVWKSRCSYRYSLETTIYLEHRHTRRGIGRPLYLALLTQLRELKYHVALGCIALPNDASVRLHESLGFNHAAHFKEVGFKLGRWVDVGYWQLML